VFILIQILANKKKMLQNCTPPITQKQKRPGNPGLGKKFC